jgi:APA family basic amino acid/polyamine antiporter
MTDPVPGVAGAPRGQSAGPSLERTLGTARVTASGVGIIIGAGVYVLIGDATALAGPRVWMSFLLAAVLSALTGLSYCELASMFPRSGAEYEYTRHAFPARVAFLVGWVMFAGLMVAAGAVATGFARYFRYFVDVPAAVAGAGLLVSVTLIALSGIQRSSSVTVVLSAIQVGGLVAVIAIGVPHIGAVDLWSRGGSAGGGVVAGAALVFFAFIGFDEVITLAEETIRPERTIPRALLLALGISTVLYVGVAITSVSVIGAPALGSSPRPLALVFDHALGGSGGGVVAFVALIATTNTAMLCLTAASRLQYGMAVSGALPSTLARVGTRRRVPYVAVLVAATVAIGFVVVGDIALIASVTDFAVYLVFIAVNLSVLVLRARLPDQPRPFRTPWCIGRIPVVPILGLATVLLMLPALRWEALAVGVGLVGTGLGVDAWLRWRAAR